MDKRVSLVSNLHISNVVFASVVHIGDADEVTPAAHIFALQRQFAVFMGNEGNLNLFPVFVYPDTPPPELDIEVKLTTVHEQNTIRVDYVDVAAVSAASVLQVGSSSSVNGKSRVMNIRQALGRGPLKMGAEAVAETKSNPPV